MSPQGPFPKAGHLEIEPYLKPSIPLWTFDNNSNAHKAPSTTQRSFGSTLVIPFSMTDQLTMQLAIGPEYNWDSKGSSSGMTPTDTAMLAWYRIVDNNPSQCIPQISLIGGATFPTGYYDNLQRIEQGGGAGAWLGMYGVHFQGAFNFFDNPLRLRLWLLASQPIGSVPVRGLSVYNTSQDFSGHVFKKYSGQVGLTFEYALTEKWVLALDLVGNVFNGSKTVGWGPKSGFSYAHGSSGYNFTLAPAIEYNFTDNVGVVGGVQITPAGRNSVGSITPGFSFGYIY